MMRVFGRALYSEALKLKRTLALKMIAVAPALAAVLSLFAQATAVMSGRGDVAGTLWQAHGQISLTIWAVFLMPLLIALEATLLAGLEHGERQWKHLFALPVPRPAIYFAKLGVVQAFVLVSTLLLCAFVALTGGFLMLWHPALAAAGFPPLGSMLLTAVRCWLAAGCILSINFWIALRWPSFTVPLASGIAGTFFAVFASSARVAKYYPWLLPSNIVTSTDNAAAALAVGIGGGVVVAALGALDFCRREESESPKLSRTAVVALCALAVGFVGFGALLDQTRLFGRRVAPAVRFVPVDANVRLEVLDWGGTGRPVVLLAGLGDTAHVFEAFASQLTRGYHVYGITRRGFGASSHPRSGYAADRLGDDVHAVIDALKLARPVVVGHSIAGEELSSLGSRYPQRVAGLVYLDAAYSYAHYDPSRGDFNIDLFAMADKIEKLRPGSGLRDPRPVLEDLAASLPGFEGVLREQIREADVSLARGGSANAPSTGGRRNASDGRLAAMAILAGEQKYTAIPVPILAIYALPHDFGADDRRRADAEAWDVASGAGPQAKAFEFGVRSARVVRLPRASHYVFQSNEADVLREMKAFIDALPR